MTGVQTCALPICQGRDDDEAADDCRQGRDDDEATGVHIEGRAEAADAYLEGCDDAEAADVHLEGRTEATDQHLEGRAEAAHTYLEGRDHREAADVEARDLQTAGSRRHEEAHTDLDGEDAGARRETRSEAEEIARCEPTTGNVGGLTCSGPSVDIHEGR